MTDQQANDMARACLTNVVLDTNIQRLRAVTNALLGLYEERAAQKQYDILGDGSV